MMKKLRILFDADDTVENLLECWIAVLNERYGTSVKYEDVKQWGIHHAFPTLAPSQVYGVLYEPDVWRKITPIIGCRTVLEKLLAEGHELYMVTASNYQTAHIKFKRILEMFPFLDWNHVIIAHHKQMIRGDILIDDNPDNLIGGEYEGILFTAPHNRDFKTGEKMRRANTWDEVYDLIHAKTEAFRILSEIKLDA